MRMYIKYVTLGAFCDNLPAPVAMVTAHYEAARLEPFDYTAMIKTLGERTEGGGRREGGVRFSRAEVFYRFYLQVFSIHSLWRVTTV